MYILYITTCICCTQASAASSEYTEASDADDDYDYESDVSPLRPTARFAQSLMRYRTGFKDWEMIFCDFTKYLVFCFPCYKSIRLL